MHLYVVLYVYCLSYLFFYVTAVVSILVCYCHQYEASISFINYKYFLDKLWYSW